ncbi:MAG: hypothetical protein UW70_C0090G0002 [Candidatus Peregrinibacteria bacterium GW2011_GWA2_44_7]|nr:MAG: hypothetical protein UW70_C0090G0002 [Candidatus Peregrinibacteria bacterium GW2011_GWA2_44_7]
MAPVARFECCRLFFKILTMSPSPIETHLHQVLRKSPAYRDDERVREAVDAVFPHLVALGEAQKENELLEAFQLLRARLEKICPPRHAEFTPEELELVHQFESQFKERLHELDHFGIIDPAHPQIKGMVQGPDEPERWYPAPSWEQIRTALTPEKLALIQKLENPLFLLVPFALSLQDYHDNMWKSKGSFARTLLSSTNHFKWDIDSKGLLVYDVRQYDRTTHGGKIKRAGLQEPGALGWQVVVVVVDGGERVPAHTLEKNPDTLLREFHEQGFGGLSIESYSALQMHGKMRQKFYDKEKDDLLSYYGFLLESYLTTHDWAVFDFEKKKLAPRGVVISESGLHNSISLRLDNPDSSGKNMGTSGARRSVHIL